MDNSFSFNKSLSKQKKHGSHKKKEESKIKSLKTKKIYQNKKESLKTKTKEIYHNKKESLKTKTKEIYHNKKKIPSRFFDLFCHFKAVDKDLYHAETVRQRKDKEDGMAKMRHDLDFATKFYQADKINVIKRN